MNWILANHLHELSHMAAATFFIIRGTSAIWEYRNLRSSFVLSYSAMCLSSAGYATYVVISHNLPKLGEFWIPWTAAGLIMTFSATFLYLFTVGQFLDIRSRLFAGPLALLGTITVVALGDLLLYIVVHRSFLFTPVPRKGIAPHQFSLGEGAYSLQTIAETLPIIFIISIVWGVGYLLVYLIRIRSTDILIYIGLSMTAAIILNESLVALSVYEGVYLFAFTKAFEAQRIYRDIIRRSQSQFERRLHEAEKSKLEQHVEKRTRQLEVANKELESFAYSVSHDLRAPLRSIDGFSQALLEDYETVLDAEGQDYLRRVRNASQRMGHLIDNLLKLSRITRQELRSETVNLSMLAQEIAEEFRQAGSERDVAFSIAEGITVTGDPDLLRVVLSNLISNAWKFTKNRVQAVIQFYYTVRDDEPVYVVKDNGAGFDMKYANKLFGAFQRLHQQNEFEGIGIGLATVQRIIHRHGGRIWAEAEVDEGATFYFTLG